VAGFLGKWLLQLSILEQQREVFCELTTFLNKANFWMARGWRFAIVSVISG
jgi:hypothetical protein